MKKRLGILVTLCCCALTASLLVGCGSQGAETQKSSEQAAASQTVKTITVTSSDGSKVDVPLNPSKVAVADLATLDIIDQLGVGDKVVGMPKGSSISYLKEKYNDNDKIANIGNVKELDMEKLAELKPDVIFVGGRLKDKVSEISQIAPVVLISVNHKDAYTAEVKENIKQIASIFGKEKEADSLFAQFDARITTIKEKAAGQSAILALVTKGNVKTLGDAARCSFITTELGFKNLAADVNSTHGDSASFELLLEKNPQYIFVLDRDTAINQKDAVTAKDVMSNEVVNKTTAAQNNHIAYLTPDVWYLAEGGISATDIMLSDVEKALGLK